MVTRKNLIYILLIAAIIFSIAPWFQEGVPATDDFRHHVAKFGWMKFSFDNYGKFVEWMPMIYSGWPMTHFYHSLPYFASIPFILLTDPVSALKMSVVFSFILAALAMFFAAKKLTKNNEIAALASIFYILAPMHFGFAFRFGSLSRLWAYIFLPLAFIYFIKLLEDGSKKNIILTGVLFAALAYTNLNITFTLSLVLFAYMIYYFIKQKKIQYSKIKNIVFAILITIGLLSFWIMPLALEREDSSTSFLIEDVIGAYPGPTKYSSLFFRDFSIKQDKEAITKYFYLSIVMIFLASLSFLTKNFKYRNVFALLALLCVVVSTNTWLIKYIPFANFIMFSYYFTLIGIILLSILAAVGTYSLSKIKKKYALTMVVIILSIFLIDIYPAQNPDRWSNQSTENYLNTPKKMDVYGVIKDKPELFRIYDGIGEAAHMYTEKPEIGLRWTGYREGAFKPIRSLTDEIYEVLLKNSTDERVTKILGYMGTKYHLYRCINPAEKFYLLNYSNDLYCIYENLYFEPIVDSPSKIMINEVPLVLEKNSAIILEACEYDCIKQVKKTKISNIDFEAEEIKFYTSGSGYVLVKSAYFEPHWHAYVNDEEVSIRKAWPYYMLIEVPEGESKVEFKYETNLNHIIGWLITILTIGVLVYLLRKK